MNGFEILRRIAATKPHLLDRILLFTAVSTVDLEKLKRGPQPRVIIRKPFDLGQFKSAVLERMNGFTRPAKRKLRPSARQTAPTDV
jgi:hypothetical protein